MQLEGKHILIIGVLLLLVFAGGGINPSPQPSSYLAQVAADAHADLAEGVAASLDAYATGDDDERGSLDKLVTDIDGAVTEAYSPLFVELQRAAGTGDEWDADAARKAAGELAGGFRQ